MDVPVEGANRPESVPQSFIGGLAVTPDGARLFAVHVFGQILSVVDLKTGHVLRTIDLPAEVYTCLVSPDGATVFVSIWGGAKVLLFDARTFETRAEIVVGEHPNAMALTKDGKRLFVACANTNAVYAIDVEAKRAVEQIAIALFPESPPGSTPNHVSLSPDETRLLVANADNNTVAVVDVAKPGSSEVEGFIPTGWYPTAAMFSRDGSRVFVLSGKGLTSSPNPRYGPRALPESQAQYIGAMLTGAFSVMPTPNRGGVQTRSRAWSTTSRRTRTCTSSRPRERRPRRRFRAGSAIRRQSSTCSTSSARTAPTTR
jgi:YVTN family beta-propeller protein